MQSPFIHGHDESCAEVSKSIKNALIEAFELCDLEMECYKATAREFSDQGKGMDSFTICTYTIYILHKTLSKEPKLSVDLLHRQFMFLFLFIRRD